MYAQDFLFLQLSPIELLMSELAHIRGLRWPAVPVVWSVYFRVCALDVPWEER